MYLWSAIVHGDDVLAQSNWELGEDWLKRYGSVFSPLCAGVTVLMGHFIRFLVDEGVLASVNKWRRARGDAELSMSDISADAGSTPSS